MKYKLGILFLLLVTQLVSAQLNQIGIPEIINFDKSDYNAASRNWGICQDKHGVIYVSNDNGILSYDGTNWNLYEINKYSMGRGIAIDQDDKVYIGSYGGFGYLRMNESGEMQYNSLLDSLPKNHRDFSSIWRGYVTKYGVYFQSTSIFFYDYNSFELITTNKNFKFSGYINDRFFVQNQINGLYELKGSKLYHVPGSEIFKEGMEIWTMLPMGDSILIGTQQYGLFIYDGFSFKEFNCEANKSLKEDQIFHGIKIGVNYSFGTKNGIYLINKKGKIIQHLNKQNGLKSNSVLSQFIDKDNQLWLALDNGISMVKINSPYSYYNNGVGVDGAGNTSIVYNNKIYLGTSQNLFVEDNMPASQAKRFVEVPQARGPIWSLEVFENNLLCGYNFGTLLINSDGIKNINSEPGAWNFVRLKKHPNYIISGHYFGMCLYKIENGTIRFISRIKGFNESCRTFVEDDNGDIWMTHNFKGAYHIKLNEKLDSVKSYSFYDQNSGLPSNFDNYVYKLDNQVIFTSEKGIYSFNPENEHFEADNKKDSLFHHITNIRSIKQNSNGDIWFANHLKPHLLRKQANGGYKLIENYERIFPQNMVKDFEHYYFIDSDNIIFGIDEGYIHHNLNAGYDSIQSFNCFINNIFISSTNDTLAIYQIGNDGSMAIRKDITVPFTKNDLKFSYVAPDFETKDAVIFQCMLDGFDNQWTKWENINQKEYTNIPPGDYEFKVRAKNAAGYESNIVILPFKVDYPWYRSIYAYVIYILIFIGIGTSFVLYTLQYIEKEKNHLIKKQNEEIKQKEEEMSKEMLLAQQKIIELRNEKLEYEISLKQSEEELKNKELASIALQITHKNETLGQIKHQLEETIDKVNEQTKRELKGLIRTIEKDIQFDDDWDKFKMHFEDVHSGFFIRLKQHNTTLTSKDLRMCAYLRMNLSTKEISQLYNISIRGVEMARYRLRRKLNLPSEANLFEFLMEV